MTEGRSSPLALIDSWGAEFSAAAVIGPSGVLARRGDTGHVVPVASITKLAVARAVLVAVEEGITALEAELGPSGCTVRHLLCHAGGLDFDSDRVLAPAGARRIYSNTGYELLAAHIAGTAGMPFADYLREAVLQPLGMDSSELRGSAARDLWSNVEDLVGLAGDLGGSSVIHPSTAADAARPQFPELSGVLPGWGRQEPCWWGLGPEIRGTKEPHWTGATAPTGTLGHFGGSGSFLWVDPNAALACVVITTKEFGEWAVAAWPPFSDAVRAYYS